eukprot:6743720-Alexandrium_andersonii.AAC.1
MSGKFMLVGGYRRVHNSVRERVAQARVERARVCLRSAAPFVIRRAQRRGGCAGQRVTDDYGSENS